jgi:hypothetical protein
MMNRSFKMTALACAGLAMTLVAQPDTAHADRRGRVAAGVVTGLVVGGIIAGAAANARASERVYVAPRGRGCYDLKRKAINLENDGHYGRAQVYWDRYDDCRSGY